MSREPTDDGYPPAVADRWDDVLADARATAAEYRDRGWTVTVIHPGDVTVLTDDPFGLDVLAPDGEFADLEAAVDRASFEETRVYRVDDDAVRFYVVCPEAPVAEEAVVVPAFLPLASAQALHRRATEAGAMYTHVRTLSGDVRVTFTHDDPDPFF